MNHQQLHGAGSKMSFPEHKAESSRRSSAIVGQHRVCAGLLACVLAAHAILPVHAADQVLPKGTLPPGPAPLPSPAPVAPLPLAGLNFLILTLDDIEPGALPTVTPAREINPITTPSVPAASIVPQPSGTVPANPPASDAAPAAPGDGIRPLNLTALTVKPVWRSLASQNVLLAKAKDDIPPFPPGPEPRQVVTPEPLLPLSPNVTIPPGTTTVAPLDNSTSPSLAPLRSNRAQGAATPLRRALVKAGSLDALTTGFDGAPVLRALNNRRLSQRTIDTLQDSMAHLIQAGKTSPDDPALRAAVQSASRIAQALGYRGVIALAVLPRSSAPAGGVARPTVGATYGMLIADAVRESGEPLVFDDTGIDEAAMNESAAVTGAASIEKIAANWKPVSQEDRRQISLAYLNQARTALAQSNTEDALDLLNQSVSMDANQVESYVMLGDLLALKGSSGAASEYSRAAQLKPSDGKVWTKVAIAYTRGATPDWPRALEAARKALALGYESPDLHLAFAVTQWGRADIFRRYKRDDQAREAEADAKNHLDRALFLAPQDDPGVMRDIAAQLVAQNRLKESVRVLDRLGKLYPDDLQIQMLLATSLLGLDKQEEEAFVAWSKVWKMQRQAQIALDVSRYTTLSEGFDRRLATLGKEASGLCGGVAQGGVPREQALIQLGRLKEDLTLAQDTIKMMAPPALSMRTSHNSRIFAADLMAQAFGNYEMYLETADDTLFNRAADLHRQAIVTLNLVRTSR